MKPEESKSESEVAADVSMFRSLDDLIADAQRPAEPELISDADVGMFRLLKDHLQPHSQTEEEKNTQAAMLAIIATL